MIHKGLFIFLIVLVLVGAMLYMYKNIGVLTEIKPADYALSVTSTKGTLGMKAPPTGMPIIIYEDHRKFSNAERAELQKKLLDPYIDYYSQTGENPVRVIIISDVNVGHGDEQYGVDSYMEGKGIGKIAGPAGSFLEPGESFLFGYRNKTYNYWLPPCNEDNTCELSTSFKQKYQEIVQQLIHQGATP